MKLGAEPFQTSLKKKKDVHNLIKFLKIRMMKKLVFPDKNKNYLKSKRNRIDQIPHLQLRELEEDMRMQTACERAAI